MFRGWGDWFFFVAQTIREILLLGHRQAFAWIDDWISMTIADVRSYECEMQRRTNTKVNAASSAPDEADAGQQRADGAGPRSPNPLSPLTNLFSPSSSSSQSGQSNNTSWFSWWSRWTDASRPRAVSTADRITEQNNNNINIYFLSFHFFRLARPPIHFIEMWFSTIHANLILSYTSDFLSLSFSQSLVFLYRTSSDLRMLVVLQFIIITVCIILRV